MKVLVPLNKWQYDFRLIISDLHNQRSCRIRSRVPPSMLQAMICLSMSRLSVSASLSAAVKRSSASKRGEDLVSAIVLLLRGDFNVALAAQSFNVMDHSLGPTIVVAYLQIVFSAHCTHEDIRQLIQVVIVAVETGYSPTTRALWKVS